MVISPERGLQESDFRGYHAAASYHLWKPLVYGVRPPDDFHIAVAEGEAEVAPDGMADDFKNKMSGCESDHV